MATCERARSLIISLPRSSEDGNFVPQNLIIERLLPKLENIIQILSCSCQDCKGYRNIARRGDRDALHERPQLEEFSKLIHQYAVSFFALLVSLRKGVLIIPFLLKRRFDAQILDSLAYHQSECARTILKDVPLDDQAIRDLDNEIEHSWKTFLRPFLGGSKYQVFSERQSLPIYTLKQLGRGVSGCVYAFKVYEHYNRIDKNATGSGIFARKELTYIDHEEVNILWDLKEKLKHPHIVQLLTSYEHNNKLNLVFPRSATNLRHFLREPEWNLGQSNFVDVYCAPIWTQTAGIIDALSSIHNREDTNQIQTHFDLKPENILVNIDGSEFHFLIADFGLSVKRDPKREGSRTRYGGGDNGYCPPEDRDLNRSYDVWSMGCIVLEILAFAVWGFEGALKLDKARGSPSDPYWEYQPEGPSIKSEIRALLENLKQTSREENLFSQALSHRDKTFIREMAKLIERTLRVRPADRPSSRQVSIDLGLIRKDEMQAQCTGNPELDTGAPLSENANNTNERPNSLRLERHLTLVEPEIRLEKPLEGEVELGVDQFRGLTSVCARRKSHANDENERVAVQVFRRTYKEEVKLRFIFARLNGKTSIEQRVSLKSLYLVPAYALRERHNVPRYLAGLRFLDDINDKESGLSHNLDGDLPELRKIHGVLLNQEICYSVTVPNLEIQMQQSQNFLRRISRIFRRSNDEGLDLKAGSATVQLWREVQKSQRECRLVFYMNQTKIAVMRFTESLGFERRDMDQKVPILTTYLNKGATSAVFTIIEGQAGNQPAFPLDPGTFRQMCVEKQSNLLGISIMFGDFGARQEFIDIYKNMKRTWENEMK